MRAPVVDSLTAATETGVELLPALRELLGQLYERDFKPWVQKRLTEQAVERLGRWKAGHGWDGQDVVGADMVRDGLAECYCLFVISLPFTLSRLTFLPSFVDAASR
jgi:hypothetical protein